MASFVKIYLYIASQYQQNPRNTTHLLGWPFLIPGDCGRNSPLGAHQSDCHNQRRNRVLTWTSTCLPWYNPPGDTISHRGRPQNVCPMHQGSSRSFMYQWRDTRILLSIKDSSPRIPPQPRFWQCYHNHPPQKKPKKPPQTHCLWPSACATQLKKQALGQ